VFCKNPKAPAGRGQLMKHFNGRKGSGGSCQERGYSDRPFDAARLSEIAFIKDTDNWLKLA
jgi:hypothetical protein